MKRILAAGAILAVCCTVGWAPAALAADKGPAEIILQSTIDPAKTPKPATFPHGAHQARLECKTCHNTKAAGMPEKLNTFKGAGHALCQDCHKKTKPELAKCSVCHKK